MTAGDALLKHVAELQVTDIVRITLVAYVAEPQMQESLFTIHVETIDNIVAQFQMLRDAIETHVAKPPIHRITTLAKSSNQTEIES